jgi:uncharacterized protein YggU (UPF0235/DUF167 family)
VERLSTLVIRPHGSGSTLRVRVAPKSVKPGVRGVLGEALKLAVAEPPERGKANRGGRERLARVLDLPSSSISLVTGGASSEKTVEIAGLAPEECRRRLAAHLGGAGGKGAA